ncbi:MAG: hypothetical protein H6506_01685 [Calditrichaeota bacterium]|nr:hypothetical protein [Calditrichota bacterium]MCB9391342.1 hypothetical protein [Calditrichota bacterium]
MLLRFSVTLLLFTLLFTGCKKDDEPEDIGAVWILYVNARDGSRSDGQMQACAHVKWTYEGDSNVNDQGCRDGNNSVKVWKPISEDVRIFYHVECEGYNPSVEDLADFLMARIDSTTESGNPEVVISRTITMFPN